MLDVLITSGTIDVKSLETLLTNHFEGNKNEFLKHLEIMIDDPRTREERSTQINICIELENYYAGANALLSMKESFQLTGDFSALEKLAQAVPV